MKNDFECFIHVGRVLKRSEVMHSNSSYLTKIKPHKNNNYEMYANRSFSYSLLKMQSDLYLDINAHKGQGCKGIDSPFLS